MVTLWLALLGGDAHAADVNAGQVQAASCAGCHGLDGKNAPNPMAPALAGQHYDYLVKQIKDFRSGKRSSAIMRAMVGSMSDTNIEHVSLWYSTLDPPARDGDPSVEGERLYQEGDMANGVVPCRVCHGRDALGFPGPGSKGFPALRGQSEAYTTEQIRQFANGTRTNDLGGMMGNISSKLSDVQVAQLANYLAFLPPEVGPSEGPPDAAVDPTSPEQETP